MRPRWLTEALKGKIPLSRAFWLYGVGVSVAYTLVGAFIDIENTVALTVYLVVGVALGVVQTVILWRSASNSPSKFLGRLVRILVIAGLILVLLMTYVLMRSPGLLTSPDLG